MGQYIITLNLKSTEETSYFISNYVFEKKVIGGTATTIKNKKNIIYSFCSNSNSNILCLIPKLTILSFKIGTFTELSDFHSLVSGGQIYTQKNRLHNQKKAQSNR